MAATKGPLETMSLDLKKVIEAVRKAAKENPDKKFVASADSFDLPGCVYSDKEGNAICIVGFALKETHPDYFEEIRKTIRANTAGTANDRPIYDLVRRSETVFKMSDLEWLKDVQMYQDGGETWADAVSKADYKVNDSNEKKEEKS